MSKTNIQDFGQKIGGARKDLAQSSIEMLSLITGDALASQPLSKVFPKPDFAKMFNEGLITAETAIRLHYLYKSIPAKPRSLYRSISSWTNKVEPIIEAIKLALQNESVLNDQPFLNKTEYQEIKKELEAANWPAEAYNPSPYRIVHPWYYSSYQGYIVAKGRYSQFKSYDIKECIKWIREQKDTKTGSGKKKSEITFTIRYYPSTGERFITPKGKNNTIVKRGFTDTKSAMAYIRDQYDDLVSEYERIRFVPEERNKQNRMRIGSDHRNGVDVTPEMFSEKFPFRGVEFGNWLNQPDRANSLNNGYDALMDLTMALKVEPELLCLDSQLALAFGSRGKGKGNAHYEPLLTVINLTKMKGAGSLAHEWFHALDNYVCIRKGNKLCYASDISYKQYDDELLLAFRNLRIQINSINFSKRSDECDKHKSKAYWGTMIEKCARAFEKYVIMKLADKGYQNDYLANIRTMSDYDMDNKYPYPTDEENKVLSPLFDQLMEAYFNTVTTKLELPKSA